MSDQEKYIKCKNCRQDILESKMFLHEGFCLRNNKLCPECDKVFLIQEFNEHFKTHNSKKSNSITEHRKNCTHHKNEVKQEIPKMQPKIDIPKKNEIEVDDNLGLKQCEYCTNMFEDLQGHLLDCDVKKMIEMENAQYFRDIEKRKKEDDDLAQKLSKEKNMDISKDEQMAKDIQDNMKPLVDINQDEEMAKNLQKQFQMENAYDISKDEELARQLQNEFNNGLNNNGQSDEEYARKLQQQENMNMNNGNNNGNNGNQNGNNNPNGQYYYGFNIPQSMNSDLYQ